MDLRRQLGDHKPKVCVVSRIRLPCILQIEPSCQERGPTHFSRMALQVHRDELRRRLAIKEKGKSGTPCDKLLCAEQRFSAKAKLAPDPTRLQYDIIAWQSTLEPSQNAGQDHHATWRLVLVQSTSPFHTSSPSLCRTLPPPFPIRELGHDPNQLPMVAAGQRLGGPRDVSLLVFFSLRRTLLDR